MMGIVEITPDGSDILHVYDSPATERFFGTGPGLTAGKTARELGVPSEAITTWLERYREAERLQGPVRFEYPHPKKEGEAWLSTVVSPMASDGSGARRFSYTTEDATERRAAEGALAESETRFHDLADNMDQLAWVVDASGDVLWFNRRWYEFTGTSPKDMEDGGWRSVHDPNELPWVLEMWRARLAENEPFAMEFPLKGADGRFRTFLTRVRPIRDESGRVARWFGTNTDVTERREAEERLRESEGRASLAIQAADLGTWDADLDTGVVRNEGAAGRIFGRAEESFTMTRDEWFALVHPDDLPRVLAAIEGLVERDEPYRVEFRAHERDGAWRWIEARGLLVRNAEGRPVRALGVFADVTARKEAQVELERQVTQRTAQLQASNDALESFTRHVAHDLRGPLRSILLACHLLADEVSNDGARDVLERQERSAKRLSLLIDDLLEMARLSRTEAARTATDVTRIARGVADEAVAAHPGTKARVEVEEGLSADADPRLLRLALGNLVENAVKYSPDGGTVRVGQREGGAFYVADEGIGIEAQYLDRVFEPFERLHTEARFKGTGIGLSNVRQIVRLHGGRVWVESEPGKGSTFLFTLG